MFVSQRLWLCDGEQPPPNAARQALDIVQGDDAAGSRVMTRRAARLWGYFMVYEDG